MKRTKNHGCIEIQRLRCAKKSKKDLFKKTRPSLSAGLTPVQLSWLKQFLKSPFLPAARFFGLLHRNFYKAEPVEGLPYPSFVDKILYSDVFTVEEYIIPLFKPDKYKMTFDAAFVIIYCVLLFILKSRSIAVFLPPFLHRINVTISGYLLYHICFF